MNDFQKLVQNDQIIKELSIVLNCSKDEVIPECKKLIKQLQKPIKVNIASDAISYVQQQARTNGNMSPAQWVNDLIKWHRFEANRRETNTKQ